MSLIICSSNVFRWILSEVYMRLACTGLCVSIPLYYSDLTRLNFVLSHVPPHTRPPLSTPSRWRSGSGCCARCAGPTPTCSSWPRRSPGPAMMQTLGAIGYHQSYTYFTWRTAKWEIEEYLREVSSQTDHLMRPNFFVNTPDILHAFLQYGGPAAFKIRAVLAATGSPSWGVYAGYELYEHVAVRPGQRGVPRLGEVPDPGARLGGRRGRGPQPRAVPRRCSTPYGAPTRPCSSCATSSSTPATTRTCWCSASRPGLDRLDRRARRPGDRGGQPRPPRRPGDVVHLDLPALGLGWHDSLAVHDELSGRTGTGASTTTYGSIPGSSPLTC